MSATAQVGAEAAAEGEEAQAPRVRRPLVNAWVCEGVKCLPVVTDGARLQALLESSARE